MRDKRFPLDQWGFTLLEVMVALAILGMGLVLIMQLFAGGLRSVKVSEDYTMAVIIARQKMEETVLADELDGATGRGVIEGTKYTWETEAAPFPLGEEDADRYAGVEVYLLKVRVKWPGLLGQKYVELSTLKTIPAQSPLQPRG